MIKFPLMIMEERTFKMGAQNEKLEQIIIGIDAKTDRSHHIVEMSDL